MITQLQSFYWVANAHNDVDNPAYQLTVCDFLEDGETLYRVRERTLNVSQAISEGFTMGAIGAAFNGAIAADLETRTMELEAKIQESDDRQAALDVANTSIAALTQETNDRGARIEEMAAQLVDLQAKLDAAQAAVAPQEEQVVDQVG